MNNYKLQKVLFKKQHKGVIVEEHLLVKSLHDHQFYVLKRTDISKISQERLKEIENHLQNLIEIKNPSTQIKNCTQINNQLYFYEQNYLVQVLEYCGHNFIDQVKQQTNVSINKFQYKAMFDFYKQQEQETNAQQNQEKLVKNKRTKRASTSVNQQRQKLHSPAQRKSSKDRPSTQGQKKVEQPKAKLMPPKPRRNNSQDSIVVNQDLLMTKGKEELQDLLKLYKDQLKESNKQYNPWLNMSEIKETTEYDTTTNLNK